MNRTLLAFGWLAVLSACSTAPSPARDKEVEQVAVTPLSDLNLVRAEIPDILRAALKAPYVLPADQTCVALTSEIHALDAALGADLDAPQTPSNPSLVERGSTALGDAAVGAARSTAENIIPFRGWVRKLTGAERYSKEVAAAITAGSVRRGFLKGLRAAKGC